ncbi:MULTISPECIES: alpha-amylase family glycosyl hydrolase [Citricoccus]|uniref:alpha-amylase family glycosyl hydrolase n=1 Tax=Citricoccus TaxID=169133 RepID=UPI000255EF44|nr:alpha-amylase family glycosyl hydrolase [Citricoccus sp. CH26A]
MQLLPLDKLGPHIKQGEVHFGFLLPWVSAHDGNRLFVKLIHEQDQFLQTVKARRFELQHGLDATYGDYWSGTVKLVPEDGGSHFGQPGRYLYRYDLESPLLDTPLDWIVDPYAREYGVGHQSAFTLDYEEHVWADSEKVWKTPHLRDLVVYEIMLHEFSWDLVGAQNLLPYLRDLGVSCIELMPVANVARSIDWGFEPIGPFGPDERFGKRRHLQRFVESAHQHGIAVILDMIHGHTGSHFAYEYVYARLGYHENPFMGSFAKDMFGPSVDYRRTFVQDFYFTVNDYWLDRYHIDGIRYDCVPNYWDGPAGVGYANLVYHTYRRVEQQQGTGHWQRFFVSDEPLRLIQCAEQLEHPVDAVEKTYSNAAWQNETLGAFQGVASGDWGRLTDLGLQLGLTNYEEVIVHDGQIHPKTVFQYLENHDHSRFLCRFGTHDLLGGVIREADRSHWYRLQPYLIALLLAKGVPLLWQGQEIGESYDIPSDGYARIGRLRPMRWEYFYDGPGHALITLCRCLLKLRADHDVFRRGQFYFHNHWDQWQSRGLLLFSHWTDECYALVALNFTEQEQATSFWFPRAGDYRERLHGIHDLHAVPEGQPTAFTVPSHYGRVWMLD